MGFFLVVIISVMGSFWLISIMMLAMLIMAGIDLQKKALRVISFVVLHTSILSRWTSLKKVKAARTIDEWKQEIREAVHAALIRSATFIVIILLFGLFLWKNLNVLIIYYSIVIFFGSLVPAVLLTMSLLMRKTDNDGIYHMLQQ